MASILGIDDEAESGEEGMRMFLADPCDLVITDLVMPGQEGIETIQLLRQHTPDVTIVAMSGAGPTGPSGYLDLARKLGAKATFAKPFDQFEMLATVSELTTARASGASDRWQSPSDT